MWKWQVWSTKVLVDLCPLPQFSQIWYWQEGCCHVKRWGNYAHPGVASIAVFDCHTGRQRPQWNESGGDVLPLLPLKKLQFLYRLFSIEGTGNLAQMHSSRFWAQAFKSCYNYTLCLGTLRARSSAQVWFQSWFWSWPGSSGSCCVTQTRWRFIPTQGSKPGCAKVVFGRRGKKTGEKI